jgi:hypothetical protein
MKCKVLAVNQEERKVHLEDETGPRESFPLEEQVKTELVKEGEAEVSLNSDRTAVAFLRMKGAPKKGEPAKPGFGQKADKQSTFGQSKERKFYMSKVKAFKEVSIEELEQVVNEFGEA